MKMNMIKVLPCIILLMGFQLQAQAQEEHPSVLNVIPPSPTAFEFSKYGQIPVGTFTGTPNFTVPIYELQGKNLQHSIYFSYSSNGVKVDQISSWIGAGWSLIGGGVITRVVRDNPDELSTRISTDDITEFDPPTWSQLISDSDNENIDTEPDLYAYNFDGYSGKFVFDASNQARFIPFDNLKITRTTDEYNIQMFVVTTPNGIKYFFGGQAGIERTITQSSCADGRDGEVNAITAWYLTKILHPSGEEINFSYKGGIYYYKSGVNETYTRVPQSEIINCSDCSNLGGLNQCLTEFQIHARYLENITTDNIEITFNTSTGRPDLQSYAGALRLSSIVIKDKNSSKIHKKYILEPEYSDNNKNKNNLHNTEGNSSMYTRMFLKSVQEYSGNDQVSKPPYVFNYYNIDNLPARCSFSQDHWGYYNGKNNTDFLPIISDESKLYFPPNGVDREANENAIYGLLKEIIYPTGGTTLIDYESNTYWGPELVIDPADYATYTLEVIGGHNEHKETVNDAINIPISQKPVITVTLECLDNNDCDEYGDGELKIFSSGNTIPLRTELLSIDPNDPEWTGTTEISISDLQLYGDYDISLSAWSDQYKCSLSIHYLENEEQEYYEYKNLPTGGMRVKRTTSKTSPNAMPQIERYYYAFKENLTESSAIIPEVPNYLSKSYMEVDCNPDYICSGYTLSSNSTNSLYNVGGNHIAYRSVIKSYGENFENGGEYFIYNASQDTHGHVEEIGDVGNETIPGATYSNTGWKSGTLRVHGKFKLNGQDIVKVEETINSYNHDDEAQADNRNSIVIKAAVVRKLYEPLPSGAPHYYECDASNISSRYHYGYDCTTNHYHWIRPADKGWKCFRPGANNVKLYSYHPCYGNNVGDVIFPTRTIENYDVMTYDIISKWNYLKSKTVSIYDENGGNPVVQNTTYGYENQDNGLLTKTIITNSEGDQITTKTIYPGDYDYNASNFALLFDKGFSGIPINIFKSENSNLIYGKSIKYNDNGQPIDEWIAENALGSSVPSININNPFIFTHRNTFQYDQNKNLVGIVPDNNYPTSYLWGYNNLLPVAQVVNALQNQVFYESFEESGGDPVGPHAKTGKKVKNSGSHTINFSPQDDEQYILSYWYWDEDENIWKYREKPFQNSINEGIQLDEIRVFPKGALMTTYTYDPLIGVTSVCDPNNTVTHYQYDDLGRLEIIKDNKQNLLQKYEYNYRTP